MKRRKSPGAANRRHRLILERRGHMQARARERFGVEIGKLARLSLVRKVHEGEVKFARRLTNSRSVVVADYEGIEVTFIYSSATKSIVTFLPPTALETAEWRAQAGEVCPLPDGNISGGSPEPGPR